MAGSLPVKLVRFRLIKPDSQPLSFAFIKAQVVPIMTGSRNSNTVFPTLMETRTNQYGIAELKLYANDLILKDSKYLITVAYDGKNYNFLIELEQTMEDILDFEDLIDRQSLEEAKKNKVSEGKVRIKGSKLYY